MDSEKNESKVCSINPTVNVNPPGIGNQAAVRKTIIMIDSLPLEMLECILKIGSNTDALKKLRLVSKSWNDVCCRILQKVSAVPLNVGDDSDVEKGLEELKDLIIDRQSDFSPDWPNPFQNFKILEASRITKHLLRFVQRPNVNITTFEIIHNEGFDPLTFEGILEQIKGELVHLKISGNSDSAPFLTLTDKLGGGGWGSLKALTLKDTCKASWIPCPHVEFILALKTNIKLEDIHLSGDFVNIVKIFADKDQCWDQLLGLTFNFKAPPSDITPEQIYELMKWADGTHFRPLTHMTLWFRTVEPEQTLEHYITCVLPLIQKSSRVVEQLRVNFLPLSLIPSLPKLKYLSCSLHDGDRIQDITEQKFPSLTWFYCHLYWTEVPFYADPKGCVSNKNIVKFTIFWSYATLTELVQELLWSTLKEHFPNLNTINIQRRISLSTLNVVRKRFTGLSSIHVRNATSSELLGTGCVPAFAAKGWPLQTYENCSLLDMADLTHLELGEFVTVSKDLISVCLGKLTKIRFLSFHWNSSLQPSDITENLGHIEGVTILYKDKQQKRELEELTKKLKSLKLVKSSYS